MGSAAMSAPAIKIHAGGLDDVDRILGFWLQPAEGTDRRDSPAKGSDGANVA